MDVLPKVLGMTVAGVLVIALYLSVPVTSALLGGVTNPGPSSGAMGFAIYLGLALTAFFLIVVMVLASTGGAED